MEVVWFTDAQLDGLHTKHLRTIQEGTFISRAFEGNVGQYNHNDATFEMLTNSTR